MALLLRAALAAALAAGAARAERIDQIYELMIGGLRAAELRLTAEIDEGRYAGSSDMRPVGLLGLALDAVFVAEVAGRAEGGTLSPDAFRADTRFGEEGRRLSVTYAGGAPAGVTAEPPFEPKPYAIDPPSQRGALDPISAAITAFAPRPPGEVCGRTIPVYDGRRAYEIRFAPAVREEGGRIRCAAAYARTAGFKRRMLDKPPFPFTAWWRIEGGRAVFDLARGPTPIGVAVVRPKR